MLASLTFTLPFFFTVIFHSPTFSTLHYSTHFLSHLFSPLSSPLFLFFSFLFSSLIYCPLLFCSSLFLFIFHLTSSLLIFSFLSPLFSSTHSLSYHYKNSLGERQTAFKYTVKAADQAISRGAFALGWAMCHQALPMAQARTEIGEVLRERE